MLAGPRNFEHDRAGMVQEVTAGCSQPHASREAHQQLRPKLRFELLDVTRQRGLRDADLVGGARDAALVGHLHEVLDAAQFHGALPRSHAESACLA